MTSIYRKCIMKGNVYQNAKKNQKIGLKINEEKTEYMHVNGRAFRDRTEHNIRTDKYNFEFVEEFHYLEANITHDNYMSSKICP